MKKLFILTGLVVVLTIGLSANFTGSWTLHYNFGRPYTYQTATLNIYGGPYAGTFTCSSFSGDWYSQDGNFIIFTFSNGTMYSGTRVGKAMVGMMSTVSPNSNQGYWYAVRPAVIGPIIEDSYDVQGEPSGLIIHKTEHE